MLPIRNWNVLRTMNIAMGIFNTVCTKTILPSTIDLDNQRYAAKKIRISIMLTAGRSTVPNAIGVNTATDMRRYSMILFVVFMIGVIVILIVIGFLLYVDAVYYNARDLHAKVLQPIFRLINHLPTDLAEPYYLNYAVEHLG